MAEQCYRRDEGNESDRRVYLRNREFERERVADDSNDREGRQRVPKSRWERRRQLPRQTKEQVEAGSRYNTNQQVRLRILAFLTAVVTHRRSSSAREEGKGPLNRSATS